MPAIISGIPGHLVEDIRFNNIYMVQKGGGSAQTASVNPPEQEAEYPEPIRFAPLPAQAFFIRHAKNVEFSNIEIANGANDARPFFWLNDVDGADFFRVTLPAAREARAFLLNETRRFRNFGSTTLPDTSFETVSRQEI
jgi:hypothetical protein